MAKSLGKMWQNIMRRKFFRLGVPFIVFVTGGSFFLKEFTSIRYDFRRARQLSKEEAESVGLKTIDIKTVEEEMLKEFEKADVDKWDNIRGPRPWEDSKIIQEEQREKLQMKHSQDKS